MVRVGCQIRERVYLKYDNVFSALVQDTMKYSPEYEVGISPGLARVHLIGSVVLCQGHLHELGSVESEGKYSDGHDVDQQSLGVAHCLQNIFTSERCVY